MGFKMKGPSMVQGTSGHSSALKTSMSDALANANKANPPSPAKGIFDVFSKEAKAGRKTRSEMKKKARPKRKAANKATKTENRKIKQDTKTADLKTKLETKQVKAETNTTEKKANQDTANKAKTNKTSKYKGTLSDGISKVNKFLYGDSGAPESGQGELDKRKQKSNKVGNALNSLFNSPNNPDYNAAADRANTKANNAANNTGNPSPKSKKSKKSGLSQREIDLVVGDRQAARDKILDKKYPGSKKEQNSKSREFNEDDSKNKLSGSYTNTQNGQTGSINLGKNKLRYKL